MPKLSRAKLEARREHILRAAAVCFDRQGFHRTTIADVRREAGVSTGAIYTYFPNKEAIIRAMLEDAQRTRRAQLDEGARAAAKHSQRAVLLQWAERAFTEEGAHVARVNVNLWAEALRDTAVAGLAKQSLANATRIVADVVARELSRTPQTAAGVRPHDVGSVLVAIQLGLEVQRAVGVELEAQGILSVLDELFRAEPPAPARRRAARAKSKSRAPGKRRKLRD
ncbi:MAG TPA: helix-turn-helix domain-containing protein [Polyangiaceae bacterium]|nr:helix-turn-helix domain-containing protein [Polyangiaceae bacterium]